MNLALIPFTAVPLTLYFADTLWGAGRRADETQLALVAARQTGVDLATKPR